MAELRRMKSGNTAARRGWYVLLLLVCVAGWAAAPAEAKDYSAERFDSRVRVVPGGAVEVTETVVFRFEDGTFSFVYRDIPRRRTDSIEIIRAEMDEREMPFGTDPGEVEVTRKSRLRVRWHFPQPVSDSTHTFTLTYRVDGVVRQSDGGDLLAWRALPGQHDYTIDSATIEVAHPVPLARRPALETRRANNARVEQDGQVVRVTASNIRKNGWVETWMHFPSGSILSSAPAWQEAERRAAALAPRWMLAAGIVFVAGLVLFWSIRQGYDAPPRDNVLPGGVSAPPDDLAPAIAGALASNGRVSHEHAMAALFSLADRGVITTKEEPKGRFSGRDFTIERQRSSRPLARHEQAALDIAFRDKARQDDSVRLSKARSRIGSRFKHFRGELYEDMRAAGLIDEGRKATRARFGATSIAILALGSVLFIVAVLLVREYRGWPMLVPTAFVAAGIAGFIFQGATTPLSNDGVRRAVRWRAYQRHLKEVARRDAHLTADSPASILPFAVALGLAGAWSKFVKAHPAAVPSWFSALSSSGDDAFPAFIAFGDAAGSGGGAGGGGGAAGGGGSGAG